MKIEYKFVTGSVEIEVADDWGNILFDLDHEESLNDRRETRRHTSLDAHLEARQYEDKLFAADDFGFEAVADRDEAKKRVAVALPCLTGSQSSLIHALYFENISPKDYAKSQGISDAAVSKMKTTALKKMKKILQGG